MKKQGTIRRLDAALGAGLLLAMLITPLAGFGQRCAQVRQEVLRLHILANSDSEADQALKLRVRDAVLEETGGLFAAAGTLESSDAQVTVEPGDGQIELSIESSVIHQFGKQIRAVVLETLGRLDVESAKVTVVDKGALDCTLKARVECAVYRSNGVTENLPWGGVIK